MAKKGEIMKLYNGGYQKSTFPSSNLKEEGI